MTMTQRQLIGSIGGHTSWARTSDRTQRTAPARRKFMERFEREVDPDGVLPPAERAARAENAKKAFFRDLALKSAKVRSRRTDDEMPTNLAEFLHHLRRGRIPADGQWFDDGCAICGSSGPTVMDHDHASGLERGRLCKSCNVLEGKRSEEDDFGLWALWRTEAPLLAMSRPYVPTLVRNWLDSYGFELQAVAPS